MTKEVCSVFVWGPEKTQGEHFMLKDSLDSQVKMGKNQLW